MPEMFIAGEIEEGGKWDKKTGEGAALGVMGGTEKHSDRGNRGLGWGSGEGTG